MLVKVGNKRKWFTASWLQGSIVHMIDQRLLPFKFKIVSLKTHKETAEAIRNMTVRGAGSIGAAAAFACVQAVLECKQKDWPKKALEGFERIANTRPTARDLFFAIERIKYAVDGKSLKEAKKLAVREAKLISKEYQVRGRRIGEHGSKLLKNKARVLTHCNAGWLALHDWGSALAPIYIAKRQRKRIFVFVDETRPRLQGAKLTAWELTNEGIEHAVIADNAAGFFMQHEEIDLCIVGADRIASNGDVANKIGTYEKAVLARENSVPFYVAAPTSTFDFRCKSGKHIPIEERSEQEVLSVTGYCKGLHNVRIAPKKSKALNPAFDVTPAKYIKGIITEYGIIKPKRSSIKKLARKCRKEYYE
jgi:translation initiation factor eIF-2B subunit alpha/methylthioribose-1-phosphate isomerase